MDKLIWPGIAGRQVLFVSVDPSYGFGWEELAQDLSELGCKVAQGEDIDRASYYLIPRYASDRSVRTAAVIGIFEGWPGNKVRRNDPRQYADFIFRMREKTKGTSDETVFLLYHNSHAFERVEHGLSTEALKRLAHYFTLHSDTPRKRRKNELKSLWLRIQQELLNTQH
ncbi:MAG TPA: hypothetical protein VGS20_14830 [Candidatus Acidoferrales bacterium]|nr:hypothetical protein [Candidatus Acidoferrales bacterium]